MRPLLSCRRGEDAGLAIPLEAAGCLVGRAPDCDLPLRDANLSRRHARFAFSEGAWRVEDLGSSNGTRLNGERLAPNQPAALTHADLVALGDDTELAFLDLERLSRTLVAGAAIVTPDGGKLTLHGADNPIGSAEDCDIIVDDPTILAHHATLRLTPQGLSILRNEGPMMVNGDEMDEAELVGGDWVSLSPSLGFSVEILRGLAAPGHREPAPSPAPSVAAVAHAAAPAPREIVDEFVAAAAMAADDSDEDIFTTGELPEGLALEPFSDAAFDAPALPLSVATEAIGGAGEQPMHADTHAAAATQRVSLDAVAAALGRERAPAPAEDAEATHSAGRAPWPSDEARTQRFAARPVVDAGDATHLSSSTNDEAITLGPGHMLEGEATTVLSQSPIVGRPAALRGGDATETEALSADVLDAAVAKAKARHDQLSVQMKSSGGVTPPPRDLPRQPSSPRGAVRREVAARLHVTYGEAEVATVLLREGRHLVGRSARCRVKLEHASIVDEHAEVSVGPDGLRIRALSPSGMLSRQGRRFADATMPAGDRFELGELTAWFEDL